MNFLCFGHLLSIFQFVEHVEKSREGNFAQSQAKPPHMLSTCALLEPRGESKENQKGAKREPKGTNKKPKGANREPEGSQRGAKGSQQEHIYLYIYIYK